MNKLKQSILKEFEEKVDELHTTQDFTNGEDGRTYEFGYKTLRGNEIFTVTDMGNIKNFLSKALDQYAEARVKEVSSKDKAFEIGNEELMNAVRLGMLEEVEEELEIRIIQHGQDSSFDKAASLQEFLDIVITNLKKDGK